VVQPLVWERFNLALCRMRFAFFLALRASANLSTGGFLFTGCLGLRDYLCVQRTRWGCCSYSFLLECYRKKCVANSALWTVCCSMFNVCPENICGGLRPFLFQFRSWRLRAGAMVRWFGDFQILLTLTSGNQRTASLTTGLQHSRVRWIHDMYES